MIALESEDDTNRHNGVVLATRLRTNTMEIKLTISTSYYQFPAFRAFPAEQIILAWQQHYSQN